MSTGRRNPLQTAGTQPARDGAAVLGSAAFRPALLNGECATAVSSGSPLAVGSLLKVRCLRFIPRSVTSHVAGRAWGAAAEEKKRKEKKRERRYSSWAAVPSRFLLARAGAAFNGG
jgi:hypothetical protein